jgi:hypothetical protein
MREARNLRTVHRDHQHAARCHACGYRAVCDEALDWAVWRSHHRPFTRRFPLL